MWVGVMQPRKSIKAISIEEKENMQTLPQMKSWHILGRQTATMDFELVNLSIKRR